MRERPPLLIEAVAAGLPDGPVLDLAWGASESAVAFSEMGRQVTAVDLSDMALHEFRPRTRAFALVMCMDFWDASVFVAGCDAASVGGLVAWESLHDDPASQLPNGFRLLLQAERAELGHRRVLMLARRLCGISFVTPWLAIGGAIRGEDDVQELLEAGVDHIINCQVKVDDAPLLGGRFAYLWNPAMDDYQAKPADWFRRSLEFVRRARRNPGSRVLIHCTEGRARSPAVAYGVLRASGFTAAEARSAVFAARPTTRARYFDDADRALAHSNEAPLGDPTPFGECRQDGDDSDGEAQPDP
jgi:hypothetical protein